MISLKRKQSGFTIVELLIVIVVIGILAALVVTTFSGIQRKARNAERESDIKAIHTQLEAYFNEANQYPTLANLNDAAWRTANNMKSLDPEALKDPKHLAANDAAPLNATAGDGRYSYAVTCAATCTSYVLTGTLEDAPAYVKNNLN